MTTNYNQPDVDTDQNLGETVTKLTAAVPYMAPPADLRGKILQATAPTTFRMEDYRRATADNGRFYRWGFAAACIFLALGGWYNLTLKSQLDTANNNMQLVQHQILAREHAIAAELVNPKVFQVAIEQNNKLAAKAFVNDQNKTAIVVLPDGALPPDKTLAEITLTREGRPVAYKVIAMRAANNIFPDAPPLRSVMNVENVQPAGSTPVFKAGVGQ